MSTSGTFELLYDFLGAEGEPAVTEAGFVQHTNGLLYSTTAEGNAYHLYAHSDGSLFSLDMGFGPSVSFVRPNGKVGQSAQILGQGLTGTSSVTFGTGAERETAPVPDLQWCCRSQLHRRLGHILDGSSPYRRNDR